MSEACRSCHHRNPLLFLAPQIRHRDPGPVFSLRNGWGKMEGNLKYINSVPIYMDAEERKKELMDKNEMDGTMFKIEDDPRILPGIGHKIRDWSLDEFPQFWNVLKET
ncbi:MAG: sugar transferase [Eubacterium sp.]